MKPNLTGKVFAMLLAVAGFVYVSPKPAYAQAQENIANINVNAQDPNAPSTPMPDSSTPNPQGNPSISPDSAPMEPAPNDNNDPPTRVARISYVDGSVSFQPGGVGDWGTAAKNRPVTIGDKIWTDKDSRAELQAGQAAIHVGSMTALTFLNLNSNVIQMRVAEGHLNFRVRELREGETYEVDAPNMVFTVREAGAFRIDVNENGDYTNVTVIRGKGEVSVAGQTYPLDAGQRGDVSGADASARYIPGSASEPDPLDKWAQERDLHEDNSRSARYVSRDTVGYSDLDDYGTWRDEPEYGHVWVPAQVEPDWAPYSNGYWNYVGPWGWTWVDYAPWGFAPFHYGRWHYFGSYWGWCPGPIYAPPIYGPAFVGFIGAGFGFGFGFGWGWGHAWFPLGWGEPYRPWYHCGPGYWHNVNYNNTHFRGNFNAANGAGYRNFNYAYMHNVHAVSGISNAGFTSGQAVNRGGVHLNEASLRGAHLASGPAGAPARSGYFGASNLHGNVSTPSASVQNRLGGRSNTSAFAGRTGSAPSAFNHGNSPTSINRGGNAPSTFNSNRQAQLNSNRPPTAFNQGSRPAASNGLNSSRPNTGTGRTWNAQGNTTDSGRAPQGFGSENRPATTQNARMGSNDRPPWARTGGSGYAGAGNSPAQSGRINGNSNRPPASYNGGNRSYTPPSYNTNRPNYNNGGSRGYSSPRSYSSPRNYSSPRSYSPSYSAPRGGGSTPHYSAPSQHYSAPHASGGGGFHSSGGGGFHSGGGGGSHGGGGGGSHGHR